MTLAIGIDVGTTTITALAADVQTGDLPAIHTVANDTNVTPAEAKARGRSEFDAPGMVQRACACLRSVAEQLGPRKNEPVGIGITGQVHGVVMVDEDLSPLGPFINWQDQRGEETHRHGGTYVERLAAMLGHDAPRRAGCRMATGHMGVSLFWMKTNGLLPPSGIACFILDFVASALSGHRPVTDPTDAASSGLFDVRSRSWDARSIEALGLPRSMFPEIREADHQLGTLTAAVTGATGLAQGMPVFVALGDNQASFLGGVADREHSVLVNVGTGAQVSAYVDRFIYAPPLETRPFPCRGNLLVNAELCGGRSYAILEGFFRAVAEQVLETGAGGPLYETMNRLAESVPSGADGLSCRPLFTGTRANPELRAEFGGVSPENFTPAHVTRALLEGLAEVFFGNYTSIRAAAGKQFGRLVGGGNGLRKNPLLAAILAEKFALPLEFPPCREEAAFGAAVMAATGAGRHS